jgi:hypothetical protein
VKIQDAGYIMSFKQRFWLEKWVSALQDEKYTQGNGTLKDLAGGDELYCCLGVLADIIDQEGWHPLVQGTCYWRETGGVILLDTADSLVKLVVEHYSIPSDRLISILIRMNDVIGLNFEDIAKELREILDDDHLRRLRLRKDGLTRGQVDYARSWVKALRSGKYEQGFQSLAEIDGESIKHCCLGVLCDIVDPSGWNKEYKYILHRGSFAFPSEKIADKITSLEVTCNGSSSGTVVSDILSMENDRRVSFAEIANKIAYAFGIWREDIVETLPSV